jgi:drug/metabolite transporter (DMT)-like permease
MLAAVVVIASAVGNLMLRIGLASVGPIFSISPLDYLKAFSNLWVIGGIIVLTAWMLLQLTLLSWADLSYVLPVTSTAYVLIAILGAVVLQEHVSGVHWAGILLILAGAVIVGRTRPLTKHGADR